MTSRTARCLPLARVGLSTPLLRRKCRRLSLTGTTPTTRHTMRAGASRSVRGQLRRLPVRLSHENGTYPSRVPREQTAAPTAGADSRLRLTARSPRLDRRGCTPSVGRREPARSRRGAVCADTDDGVAVSQVQPRAVSFTSDGPGNLSREFQCADSGGRSSSRSVSTSSVFSQPASAGS